MVIITDNFFPPGSSKEIGKAFLDLSPLPDYITMKGPYIKSAEEKGIRSIIIYECEKAKIADAFEFIAERLTNYYEVPGYKYSADVYLEAGEAFKMIGLA